MNTETKWGNVVRCDVIVEDGVFRIRPERVTRNPKASGLGNWVHVLTLMRKEVLRGGAWVEEP
jgi:hypothetical protein